MSARRTQQLLDNASGQLGQVYSYGLDDNQLAGIAENGVAARSFSYDAAGHMLTDSGPAKNIAYSYNHNGRLSSVSVDGTLKASYVYNAQEQLASRTLSNMVPFGTLRMVYDRAGHLIAETNDAGATVREYIWLNERPIAVIDDVDTASPQLYHVHVDHLERPVMMTDATKAVVWQATFEPFGSVHAITGSASLNARFPGQWFMLESGLHYNWHRYYDPTTGRYTTPDPLGFVDGPSVYGYAGGSPLMWVDRDGRLYLGDFILGTGDFTENYSKMKASNTKGADKYFHCMANCLAAQRGTGGRHAAWCLSEAREIYGQHIKGDPIDDSNEDQEANRSGRERGAANPEGSCRVMCSSYRPRGLHTHY